MENAMEIYRMGIFCLTAVVTKITFEGMFTVFTCSRHKVKLLSKYIIKIYEDNKFYKYIFDM
jgi:hypothetical protein